MLRRRRLFGRGRCSSRLTGACKCRSIPGPLGKIIDGHNGPAPLDQCRAFGHDVFGRDLRQQIKGRVIQDLTQCKMHCLTLHPARFYAQKRILFKAVSAKTQFLDVNLLLHRTVADDFAIICRGQRQIQANQNARLAVPRPNACNLHAATATRNEIQAVDTAGDVEIGCRLLVEQANAPIAFGKCDIGVAPVYDRNPSHEQRGLHDVTGTLGDELAAAVIGIGFLAGIVGNGANRKSQVPADLTLHAAQRRVERCYNDLDGGAFHQPCILRGRRHRAGYPRCAGRQSHHRHHSHFENPRHILSPTTDMPKVECSYSLSG